MGIELMKKLPTVSNAGIGFNLPDVRDSKAGEIFLLIAQSLESVESSSAAYFFNGVEWLELITEEPSQLPDEPMTALNNRAAQMAFEDRRA